MNLAELRNYKPQILAIAEQYGVKDIRVFGSVARGDADDDSDVDLLFHLADKKSLWDLLKFKYAIEALIKKRIDLCQLEAVKNPIRRARLEKEQVAL